MAPSKGHRQGMESGIIESSMEDTEVEKDDLSVDQTSITSTEMSCVESHSVALKHNGRKVVAEEEGTKITGYRLMTLRRFLKSHRRGDITWMRPRRRRGRGCLRNNIHIVNQATFQIDVTV